MQIARTTSKYYVLSVLGAVAMAIGVLSLASSAQAQVVTEPPSIDKECNPNPVQIGGTITCTIDLVASPNTNVQTAVVEVTDTFPAGLRVTGATSEQLINGVPVNTVACDVNGNTVKCPSDGFIGLFNEPGLNRSLEVTIDATAEECGTFTNTARASGRFTQVGGTFEVEDTEEIIVVGCEEPTAALLPPPGHQQQEDTPAPITQEGEQESEAGEIDQSFEVS